MMEMAMTTTTALVVCFVSLLLLFLRSFLLPPSVKLPPGPRPLPIFGNVLMMRKFGSPHNFANELKRRYGPIVTLWMCSKPVVIISGPEIIQEAMISQGTVFNARSCRPSFSIVTDGHRLQDAERNRFVRRLMVSGFLSNKRVAQFRPIREQEVDILVDSLREQIHENDGGVVSNFRPLIRLTVCNLIVGILFGRRLDMDEYMNLDEVLVERFQRAVGTTRDFMPWLAWLPDREGVKSQLELRRKISRIIEPLIEERKEALKLGQRDRDTLVDTLLRLREGAIPSPVEILDSDVVLICIEILNAGADTTALNLEYCIANLVNHPDMQEKLAKEISSVAGERVVTEDDLQSLPYLQAVVKESLRRHSPARLAPSRRALSATKVAGYDIPLNTLVFQHLEGVSLSPELWDDPLEFRPERFLNKSVDVTGSTEITMIPFGVGRRICPAMNIAFLHAEIILARLIQAFQWNLATPGKLLDLSPGSGLTAPMKYPLDTSLQERIMVP
ncbi:unnamed protein product [Calypogeia fissa]